MIQKKTSILTKIYNILKKFNKKDEYIMMGDQLLGHPCIKKLRENNG